MPHAVDIQTQVGVDDQGVATAQVRYRWRCSCGDVGNWHERPGPSKAARRARNGGARHVAMLERGKR